MNLLVRMEIPIAAQELVSVPTLTFAHWLPLQASERIHLQGDLVDATLWFDVKTTWWGHQPTEDELPSLRNVSAHFVYADVTAQNVSDNLAYYIFARDYTRAPTDEESTLESEARILGESMLRIALTAYNRMIAYIRATKGQYWLDEYPIELNRANSYLTHFKAQVELPDGTWHFFHPGVDSMIVHMVDEDRYITAEDWRAVQEAVNEGGRVELVGSLLAGAEELAAQGHTRSALTEAVTALEVALFSFAGAPEAAHFLDETLASRMGLQSLKKQVERVGLTGSVFYLLPLIIPPTQLPADLLGKVRDAISARQSVVHNGQRAVRMVNLERYLLAIRQLCVVLGRLSRPQPTSDAD